MAELLQPTLDEIYDAHVDFVWRAMHRLGVEESSVDDAVQDVFLVIHRRLGAFEGRSSLRTWIYGIALRIADRYRRKARRHEARVEPLAANEPASPDDDPLQVVARNQDLGILDRILDHLDDSKRQVFVMVEIEGAAVTEVAGALETNVNTIYARLRAARRQFWRAAARVSASLNRKGAA